MWVHGPGRARTGWEERAKRNMPFQYLTGLGAVRASLKQSASEKRW